MWTKPDMADIRQNTIYGIAVFAKHMNPQMFKSLVPNCIKAIELCLFNPEAQSEDHIAVTENAIVTLGYVSFLHSQDASHVTKFVSALPLKGDEEAQEAHLFLFKQILAKNFCNSQDSMTKAVLAIKEAHASNPDLLTDEGVNSMNQVLQMWMINTLPNVFDL